MQKGTARGGAGQHTPLLLVYTVPMTVLRLPVTYCWLLLLLSPLPEPLKPLPWPVAAPARMSTPCCAFTVFLSPLTTCGAPAAIELLVPERKLFADYAPVVGGGLLATSAP